MRRKEVRNIFHNLIKDENSLTQAFCNLMKIECFKDMFIGLLNKKREEAGYSVLNPSKIKPTNFETEVVLKVEEEEKGRVDLVLNYENEECLFEIKIERGTHLTENQPQSYLEYLDKRGYGYKNLYFILPKGYYHEKELLKRLRNALDGLTEDELYRHIFYWDDIAKEIKRLAFGGAIPFLQEFYELIFEKWIGYEKIAFTQKEFEILFKKGEITMQDSPVIPMLIKKLFRVVDGVKANIKQTIDYVYQSPDFYGYVLNNKHYGIDENIEIFYGVDYEIWAKKGCPLVVEVYSLDEKVMQELYSLKNEGFEEFLYDDCDKNENEICKVFFKCLKKDEIESINKEGDIIPKLEELLSDVVATLRNKFPNEEQ